MRRHARRLSRGRVQRRPTRVHADDGRGGRVVEDDFDRPDDEDAETVARASNESDASIGGTPALGVELEHGRLFDGRTGENLLR